MQLFTIFAAVTKKPFILAEETNGVHHTAK